MMMANSKINELEDFKNEILLNLIPYSNIPKVERNITAYMWDDLTEFKERLITLNLNDYYIYTIIDEDNEGYIIPGKKFINRIGYLISSKNVKIDTIRIW